MSAVVGSESSGQQSTALVRVPPQGSYPLAKRDEIQGNKALAQQGGEQGDQGIEKMLTACLGRAIKTLLAELGKGLSLTKSGGNSSESSDASKPVQTKDTVEKGGASSWQPYQGGALAMHASPVVMAIPVFSIGCLFHDLHHWFDHVMSSCCHGFHHGCFGHAMDSCFHSLNHGNSDYMAGSQNRIAQNDRFGQAPGAAASDSEQKR